MKKKKLTYYILIVAMTLLIVITSYNITAYIYNYFKHIKEMKRIEEEFVTDSSNDYLEIDLNELSKRNADTVAYLKIDGTNIRIVWDGHKVSYFGRTDKAQIPSQLMNRLIELFGGNVNEEMFEQKFGNTPVMLIGEGYGAKIQKCGGDYRADNDFILFDVCVNGKYLSRENVKDIANYFNIDIVPTIMIGSLQKGIDYVKTKPKSKIGIANMEGLVARPLIELQDRVGNRVIVKIKVCDFE